MSTVKIVIAVTLAALLSGCVVYPVGHRGGGYYGGHHGGGHHHHHHGYRR